MLLQSTHEGSLWRYYPLSLPCWLILPLSFILSPCDMCHSLIGCKEAQSMCSPLIQSKPSISFALSLHPSHQSLKPLAYKLDPLPSHFITIIQSNITMLFWQANPYQIHHPYPNFTIQPPLKPSWSYPEHTSQIQSKRQSYQQREPLIGRVHLMAHIPT